MRWKLNVLILAVAMLTGAAGAGAFYLVRDLPEHLALQTVREAVKDRMKDPSSYQENHSKVDKVVSGGVTEYAVALDSTGVNGFGGRNRLFVVAAVDATGKRLLMITKLNEDGHLEEF